MTDQGTGSEGTGLSGPEFTQQRSAPMPPVDMRTPTEPPPDAAKPHELEADRWAMGTPAAPPSRSRVWLIGVAIALAVAVVVGVVVLRPEGAEGEPIAYAFEPGQELNYRMRATMEGNVSLEGLGSESMSMEMAGVIRMKVRSVDAEGVATIDLTLEDLTFESDPPVETGFPDSLEEAVKIAPDGRLLQGSLGFSELGAASQAPPGWDQYSPLLPDGPVSPGDTWSDSTEMPFAGDVTIPVETESSLLDYIQEDGQRIAVVKSEMHIPLNVRAALSDFAGEAGMSAADLGLPSGADPTFGYDGTMDMVMVARIDPVTQELKGTSIDGTMDVSMTVSDIPGVGDVGPVKMTMDIAVSMEQFQGRKDKGPRPAEAA